MNFGNKNGNVHANFGNPLKDRPNIITRVRDKKHPEKVESAA